MIPLKLIILIVAAVGSLFATVLNALYGPRAQARKRLKQASRQLTDGAVVTLTGKVVARAPLLIAPLSGRDVVAFAAMARIYEQRGRSRVIADRLAQTQLVEFVLDTSDGPVEIEPGEVMFELPPEPIIPRKIEREHAFLEAGGKPGKLVKDAGFDEVALTPGMKVSVHGAVRIEVAPGEAGYRETGKRIILSAPPGHPLTIGRPV